jgi:hypothetical protein
LGEKLGLQVIAFADGEGRQAGCHYVSEEGLVAAEGERNCLYHFCGEVQGDLEQEQVALAHYEQEALELEGHLTLEWMGVCQVRL